MNEDIKKLLEQLQCAIVNPRCIEKEKASRYYCAIKELQQQLEQREKALKEKDNMLRNRYETILYLSNKKENLEKQLEQKNKVIDNAKKWVCNYKKSWEPSDEAIDELNELLNKLKKN